MSGLGLAATANPIRCQRHPVARPCRVSLRPRGLDVDTKICVACGAPYTRAADGSVQWANRRYCSAACYQRRERRPIAERFWAFVRQGSGCWEWTGARNPISGYGSFGIDRETMRAAHRVSWELHFGPIPADLFVCHHCDNPPCVRPDYLFLGTPMANVRDMDRKGRRGRGNQQGTRNPNAKLTDAIVIEIRRRRAAGETARSLAAEFGVAAPLISYIAKRKAWRHVA